VKIALIKLLLDEMWNEMSHSFLTYGVLKGKAILGDIPFSHFLTIGVFWGRKRNKLNKLTELFFDLARHEDGA
jgi:hypothetical protein